MFSFIKNIKPANLGKAAVALAAAIVIPSCGGGGGAENYTIRPKSLDELTIIINGYVFEFNRTIGTAAAINDGDIETGTFLYTGPSEAEVQEYERISDFALFDVGWPNKIQTVGYSYRAINNASAELVLEGFDVDASQLDTLENGGYVFGISQFDPDNEVTLVINFTTDGATIDCGISTIRSILPAVQLDPGYILSAISIETTETGSPVPENYNPTIDPDRPSKIAPETLDGGLLSCTNGIPDTTKDFTLQFTKIDNPLLGPDDHDEEGIVTVVVDGTTIIGGGEYTWERIGGTDNGTLILSMITNGILFDGELNSTYTLEFLGNDNGNYVGVDADHSGTFIYTP